METMEKLPISKFSKSRYKYQPPARGEIPTNDSRRRAPVSEIDRYLGQEPSCNSSVSELIQQLPYTLRRLLGTASWPEDYGLGVSESIVEGVCTGASDGSLITKFRHFRGSYGYILSGARTSDDIVGYGPAPSGDKMSSLTTESYGLIGLLILLHVICSKYQLCSDECFNEVTIYIDNKTLVERGNRSQELINLSDYSIPDQDLWSLVTELRSKLPIVLKLKWIRGHQDLNKRGEQIHSPFLKEVYLNILVDDLAKQGMKQGDNGEIK
jgi:hypothetical protein